MIELPVTSDYPSFKFKTTLEGTVYQFNLRYNERFERWILDILTSAGEDLVSGVPLLIGEPLLNRFKDERLPPVEFRGPSGDSR